MTAPQLRAFSRAFSTASGTISTPTSSRTFPAIESPMVPRTAVEVDEQLVSTKIRQLCGQLVQLLGRLAVNLVEAQRRKRDPYPTQAVLDGALAIEGTAAAPQDDVVLCAIHIDDYRGHLRADLQQPIHIRVLVRHAVSIEHQAHHHLPRLLTVPQIEMAQKPSAAFFIVGGDAVLAREAEGILQNLLKKGRLQITPRAGNNPMAALGKKTRHNLPILPPG